MSAERNAKREHRSCALWRKAISPYTLDLPQVQGLKRETISPYSATAALERPTHYMFMYRVDGCGRALLTEKVESGTSQSKNGTCVDLR